MQLYFSIKFHEALSNRDLIELILLLKILLSGLYAIERILPVLLP